MKKIKRITLLLAGSYLLWTNYLLQINSTVFGVLAGICLGIFFFLLADIINRYLINRRIKGVELKSGEEIILAEPSTHYTGNRGAMGKLFLTNKRILFVKQNVMKSDAAPSVQIERRQIKHLEDYNRAALPTGINLYLRKGASFTFAVDDREEWKAALNQKS
ncbi:MAG: hypothetical protein AAF806_15345 [Bacteroidota bacterium]